MANYPSESHSDLAWAEHIAQAVTDDLVGSGLLAANQCSAVRQVIIAQIFLLLVKGLNPPSVRFTNAATNAHDDKGEVEPGRARRTA